MSVKAAGAVEPRLASGRARLEQDEVRVDGREKVRGEAKYAADFAMDGMLWAGLVTSAVPHARIISIDASKARAMPGVHAVLTGGDIGERRFGRVLLDWPVLAVDKVRFIGDNVAIVGAETREIAETAAAAIGVRYEELPAILDPEEAIASSLHIHENAEGYTYLLGTRPPVPHPNVHGYDLTEIGDIAAGFAAAVRTFEHTFTTPRYFGGYIEPRATLVWIDDEGLAHVVSTNKSPYDLREQLAAVTGRPAETFVIEPCFIGGDFGSKGLSIEEFPCYYLALATGRPVKYVRDYTDDMRATVTRHTSKITLRSGVDANGRFSALAARMIYNGGAYIAGRPIPSLIPGAKAKTPYVFRNARVERVSAYTNTVPAGQVRDPAGVPLVFAVESHVDMVARELGIDPLEFRLRNAIRGDERDIDGVTYAEPRGVAVLEALREAAAWERPLPPGRGRGVSMTSRHVSSGTTGLQLTLGPDGIVAVRTGTTEQGVGSLTLIARVVGSVLDVDPALVWVVRDSTATMPRDPGPGGSRGTHVVGQAAFDAAEQLRVKLEAVGYPKVGWDRAVAELTRSGPLEITGTYAGKHRPGDPEWHNFSAYCVEASVDGETGAITVHDVAFAADVGTIINPVAHRGQIDGGFAFGLGHALTEELQLDDARIINPSLADYKLPTQMDMPPFRVVYVPTDRGPGPFGAKMAGELSTSGVAPAIANAVADACRVRLLTLPLTAERVFDAIRKKEPE